MDPAPVICFSTVGGFPEYMTLPAPVIDTFSVSLTATSAWDAPVDEISAVLVWSASASNLLAPVMSVTSSSTLPSRKTLAAPVDSIAKLCPESCFAVSRAAPVNFAPERVELEMTTLTPCVDQIFPDFSLDDSPYSLCAVFNSAWVLPLSKVQQWMTIDHVSML